MVQLWLHTTRTSATYDEPFHLFAGYQYLQCGDYGLNPEHPPLAKLLAALPIAKRAVGPPCGSKTTTKPEGFLAGATFVAQNCVDRILIPARMAISLISLLLVLLVFLAAREMFGPAAAFVAVTLFVFEPNLIAHGALVTTDIAITATMFGAVYARRTKVAAAVVALLLVINVVTSVLTFPNYLAFSNLFWGGTNHTHEMLTDSDVDWGQNLKLVKQYLDEKGAGRDCWLAYWGPGEVARASQPCHLMPAAGWIESRQDIDIIPPVIEGLIFISTQALPPLDVHFAPFTKVKPVALLGGGIKVYEGRFEVPLAAAVSRMGLARRLLDQGRFEEAIVQNREAVKLVPDHPQGHLVLAEALAAAGKIDEATKSFEKTIELAERQEHLTEVFVARARLGLEHLNNRQLDQTVVEGPK